MIRVNCRPIHAVLIAVALVFFGCGADGGGSTQTGDVSDDSTADGTGDTNTDGGSDVVGPDGGDDTEEDVDMGLPPAPDADGDGISDEDEGDGQVDTDGDGTPDSMDDDSDGDGILDADEAGDADTNTPPADSDGDGTPDFRDLDSDDNGIEDSVETNVDTDGNGVPDFIDGDNDGDGITDVVEIAGETGDCNNDEMADAAGTPAMPWDCDGDGTPDYMSVDSDGDYIDDRLEGSTNDTDMDTFLDRYDSDSDNDGISDADEAGDTDLSTPPRDTDGDGTPDFRDPDSDNDGLSDQTEVNGNTDPYNADSDGDGVTDLIEVTAGTDPNDMNDNPQARGDFVFLIPYQQPTDPQVDTLLFRTSIAFADIYYLFDISGSMGGEIGALQMAVGTVMGNLTCGGSGTACMNDSECPGAEVCSPFSSACIEDPSTSSCILSPWSGAGYYENTYEHQLELQPDPTVTSTEFGTWSTYGGTEELNQAVWGVADPAAAPQANGCDGPSGGSIGCPAYRSDAVRILVAFTDEDSDGGETAAQAGNALIAQDITFIGVNSGGSASRSDLIAVANASNSVDGMNNPLVYDGSDSAVVPAVTTAINEIVQGVPLRVTIEATDEPGDDGDALQFIDRLETNTMAMGCSNIMTEDSNGDMVQDAFPSVLPGTPVCWDVYPIPQNDIVQPTEDPQLFEAKLTVFGDSSPLDSRSVFFLIPPEFDFNIN